MVPVLSLARGRQNLPAIAAATATPTWKVLPNVDAGSLCLITKCSVFVRAAQIDPDLGGGINCFNFVPTKAEQ